MIRSPEGMQAKDARLLIVWTLLLIPLVAAVALPDRYTWTPTFEMAMTEQRVRDVFTAHPPLIGLPGRLGHGEQASHPGPLALYLLAPVHAALGDTAWALQVATVVLDAAALVIALALSRRRGGTAAMIATGLGLAMLMQGYGLTLLVEPWNPHLPVLWFAVFLLALWCIAEGDPIGFPIAAGGGSLCAQSHIPYVAVCGGLAMAAIVAAALALKRAGDSVERRRTFRFLALTAGILVLVWTPPLLDEVLREPGNLSRLVDYFAHPPNQALGVRGAIPFVLARLDVWYMLVEQLIDPGGFNRNMPAYPPEPMRGAALFVAWVVSAALALRLRDRTLVILHALGAVALCVAVLATSRIFGGVWPYLVFWAWSIGMLVLFTTAATLVTWIRRRPRWPLRLPASGFGFAAIAIVSLRLTVEAPRAVPTTHHKDEQLRLLIPDLLDALETGRAGTTGDNGRYLVTWSDPGYGAVHGAGLLNELDRAGYDVGTLPELSPAFGAHHTIHSHEATHRIHLATGGWIKAWKRTRGATEVAHADLITAEDRADFEEVRTLVLSELGGLGRKDVIRALSYNLYGAASPDAGLPPFVALAISRWIELGGPLSVFIAPPDAMPGRQRRKKAKRGT